MDMHKQHYENLWKKVGLWEHESPNYKTRAPQQETLDFIEFLRSKGITKGKALDIGCGGGRHVIAFAKAGFESYGIDFSKTAINLAKLDAKDKDVNANFKVGNILTSKYPEQSFDIIHDSGCLHHLNRSEQKKYLNIILNLLKPNGYYKLFCFNENTQFFTGKKIQNKTNFIINKGHYTFFFSKKHINDLFAKKFKILKVLEEKRKDNLRSFYIFYMQKI